LDLTITGKHIEITPTLRSFVQSKTERLQKYYSSIQTMEVILEGKKEANSKFKVEIIAKAKRRRIFVAKESGVDALGVIEAAAQKLEQRLRKIKTKERDRKHSPRQ
jgi:putative sigma-54 modulation protein